MTKPTKRAAGAAAQQTATNPLAGVTLELGGKSRVLRFTNRSLIKLEEQTGLTIGELGDRLTAGSLKSTVDLVWAGLLHEEPMLTTDDVADLIDLSRLGEMAEVIGAAFTAAFGDLGKGKA